MPGTRLPCRDRIWQHLPTVVPSSDADFGAKHGVRAVLLRRDVAVVVVVQAVLDDCVLPSVVVVAVVDAVQQGPLLQAWVLPFLPAVDGPLPEEEVLVWERLFLALAHSLPAPYDVCDAVLWHGPVLVRVALFVVDAVVVVLPATFSALLSFVAPTYVEPPVPLGASSSAPVEGAFASA